jgi:hypothetical protein
MKLIWYGPCHRVVIIKFGQCRMNDQDLAKFLTSIAYFSVYAQNSSKTWRKTQFRVHLVFEVQSQNLEWQLVSQKLPCLFQFCGVTIKFHPLDRWLCMCKWNRRTSFDTHLDIETNCFKQSGAKDATLHLYKVRNWGQSNHFFPDWLKSALCPGEFGWTEFHILVTTIHLASASKTLRTAFPNATIRFNILAQFSYQATDLPQYVFSELGQ